MQQIVPIDDSTRALKCQSTQEACVSSGECVSAGRSVRGGVVQGRQIGWLAGWLLDSWENTYKNTDAEATRRRQDQTTWCEDSWVCLLGSDLEISKASSLTSFQDVVEVTLVSTCFYDLSEIFIRIGDYAKETSLNNFVVSYQYT